MEGGGLGESSVFGVWGASQHLRCRPGLTASPFTAYTTHRMPLYALYAHMCFPRVGKHACVHDRARPHNRGATADRWGGEG